MTATSQNSGRFSRRRAVAVIALLQSGSVAEAAQTVGISTRTLQRWKAQPAFADQLLAAQTEIFQKANAEVRKLALDAVRTLGGILRDASQPAPSRVRSALGVIHLLMRNHDREVIEARLTRLEATKKERKNAGRQHS
jgi:hypothetical protein